MVGEKYVLKTKMDYVSIDFLVSMISLDLDWTTFSLCLIFGFVFNLFSHLFPCFLFHFPSLPLCLSHSCSLSPTPAVI